MRIYTSLIIALVTFSIARPSIAQLFANYSLPNNTANYLVGWQMVRINHWIGQTVIYIQPFVITEWVYARGE